MLYRINKLFIVTSMYVIGLIINHKPLLCPWSEHVKVVYILRGLCLNKHVLVIRFLKVLYDVTDWVILEEGIKGMYGEG